MSHTPGPWGYEKYCGTVRVFYDIGRGTRPICKLIGEDEEANAHLIAAAPHLFEALEMMLEMSEMGGFGKAAAEDVARAAIAKAKGE
jgi:hypothetical protein